MGVQRRRRGRLAGSRIRPRRQWTAHHRNVPHQVHQFLKNPSLSNLVLKNEGLRMVPTSLRQRHLSTHKIGRPCMMVMNWRWLWRKKTALLDLSHCHAISRRRSRWKGERAINISKSEHQAIRTEYCGSQLTACRVMLCHFSMNLAPISLRLITSQFEGDMH